LTVQTDLVKAPPGDAVIEDADRFEADLIIVGAREQGPIAATLLGSVSAEIMDRAACSVLVSRGPPVERVLLATDGSTPARVAVDIVASWPLFASAQIRVLGVASPPPRYAGQLLSPANLSTAEDGSANVTKAAMNRVVGEAVDQLTAARRDVQGSVRTGDARSRIVAAAREWRTDLVVIGATGQSPLRSILLGSVARQVLHRVSASVLVARPQRGMTHDPDSERPQEAVHSDGD
jgi:nucleotide-binding universal stress UspA family protein